MNNSSYIFTVGIAIAAFAVITPSAGAFNIYFEDFNDSSQDGKGATGPTPTTDISGVDWTIDITNADLTLGSNDWFRVENQVFEGRNLDGEASWLSPVIDISSYGSVGFSLDASEDGDLDGVSAGINFDYYDVSYILDGAETLITNWDSKGDANHTLAGDKPDDNDWVSTSIIQNNLSGSNFQLKVTMQNSALTETMGLDNVAVFEEVPFEFNCLPGLLLVGSFWGLNKLRQQLLTSRQ